jgi:hypothetical protein
MATVLDGALLGALTLFERTGIFGAVSLRSSLFHSATRPAIASELATLCLPGPEVVVGADGAARIGCAATRRAADFIVRIVGCGLDAGCIARVARPGARDADAAVPGREAVGLVCVFEGVAAALRSFARSRGESICEATASRTFAEPTITDFGRGLRAVLLSGRRGTACTLLSPFKLADPDATVLVAVTVGDTGVTRPLARFSKASGPSDRFSDSCILYMSSCIDERRRVGVPKLCDLLGAPGLEGVEGEANFDDVAVLGRD